MKTLYNLIEEAAATGAGQSIRLPVVTNDHAFECFIVDANTSITVVVVDIEMSFDPPEINDATAKWYQLSQHTFTAGEITALQAAFVQLNIPAQRIRANLTTLTGIGAGDKVSVRYSPLYRGQP
jgi:hypothetical protein